MPDTKLIRYPKTIIFLWLALSFVVRSALSLDFSPLVMGKIQTNFGVLAKLRVESWSHLINQHAHASELEKLQKVNDFFNQNLSFIEDKVIWNQEDYWATPIEFILKGGGDCEDYAIAKYFTLVELGIEESKLRINYVKILDRNQAHMVLTYYESPQAMPMVLDNLDHSIKPANQRRDLQPIYSFNASSLWLAKSTAADSPADSSDTLSLWQDIKQRALLMPF